MKNSFEFPKESDNTKPAEVAKLNQRYGNLLNETELLTLYDLVSGHPCLTKRVYVHMTVLQISFAEIMGTAGQDHGLFAEHLRTIHRRLTTHAPELLPCLRRLIQDKRCDDPVDVYRLEGLGLIRRTDDRIIPRCKLYAHYFEREVQ